MAKALPTFRYHPDPIATGTVVRSDEDCECCGRARGYAYEGPIHSDDDLELVCPWCIADGSAHEKHGAEFTDRDSIGDRATRESVPERVADTIAFQTPGFLGWQETRWWVCCSDGGAFLGRAGKAELMAFGPELVDEIRREVEMDGDDWVFYLDALDKDDSPTAYVFRCLHCGKLGGYSDSH